MIEYELSAHLLYAFVIRFVPDSFQWTRSQTTSTKSNNIYHLWIQYFKSNGQVFCKIAQKGWQIMDFTLQTSISQNWNKYKFLKQKHLWIEKYIRTDVNWTFVIHINTLKAIHLEFIKKMNFSEYFISCS